MGGGPIGFSCSAREISEVLHLRFAGELDVFAIEGAAASLREPLEAWSSTVVLDLQDVSFIDSAGLRFMIQTKRHIERRGGQLWITLPSESVKRLIELSRLNAVFPMIDIDRFGIERCAGCGELRAGATPRCPGCGR